MVAGQTIGIVGGEGGGAGLDPAFPDDGGQAVWHFGNLLQQQTATANRGTANRETANGDSRGTEAFAPEAVMQKPQLQDCSRGFRGVASEVQASGA